MSKASNTKLEIVQDGNDRYMVRVDGFWIVNRSGFARRFPTKDSAHTAVIIWQMFEALHEELDGLTGDKEPK